MSQVLIKDISSKECLLELMLCALVFMRTGYYGEHSYALILSLHQSWVDPEVGGGQWVLTPWKNTAAIDFPKNSGTDYHREALSPLGSNCLSRKARTALCEIHC